MKFNLSTIINLLMVLVVVTLVVLVFNNRDEIKALEIEKEMYREEALRQEQIAIEQATLARQAQAEAERQQELAEEERNRALIALKECQGK